MSKASKLSKFSIEELQLLRQQVLEIKTKDELISLIDSTIQKKTYELTKSMNSRFLVDWFNIDKPYIDLLHNNGITNLAQLRDIDEEDLWHLRGMTKNGFSQISWARDFFDMTPIENIAPSKRDNLIVAKAIVKHANECRKKHGDV